MIKRTKRGIINQYPSFSIVIGNGQINCWFFLFANKNEELEVDDTKELRKREGEHMKISMPVL